MSMQEGQRRDRTALQTIGAGSCSCRITSSREGEIRKTTPFRMVFLICKIMNWLIGLGVFLLWLTVTASLMYVQNKEKQNMQDRCFENQARTGLITANSCRGSYIPDGAKVKGFKLADKCEGCIYLASPPDPLMEADLSGSAAGNCYERAHATVERIDGGLRLSILFIIEPANSAPTPPDRPPRETGQM